MDDIIIKNPVQNTRFEMLFDENKNYISSDLKLLIKNVVLVFKRHSNNEEYMVLALIYGLILFHIIDKDHELITKNDLKNIETLKKCFKYDIKGEYKNYLDEIIIMDRDLFLLKTIIKYNILSFEKKFINIVPNLCNYYKSIGYLIPYLTYVKSPFLSFFQDIYFKKTYPHKFEKIRKYYIEKISKVEFPGEHMFTIVNNIGDLMTEVGVIGKLKVRRKTYFSIYNKLIRKKGAGVLDTIGIRLIFLNIEQLYNFSNVFEDRYVYISKKDYIKEPKINGYRSIHYKYISPYRDTQVLVEIQLRTIEMDKEISDMNSISHFSYTVKQNKWHRIFREIHAGYNYINKKYNLN